jgi:transposase
MTTSYIGIVIQICVLDRRGEPIAEERIRYRSLEEGLDAVAFARRFGPDCRVAVEALGLNRWFVNACVEAGLEVLVCDPRKLDLKKLGKKTDRRDAREIARRLWLGDLDRMARTYTRATRSTVGASCSGSATGSYRCASRPSTSCVRS